MGLGVGDNTGRVFGHSSQIISEMAGLLITAVDSACKGSNEGVAVARREAGGLDSGGRLFELADKAFAGLGIKM